MFHSLIEFFVGCHFFNNFMIPFFFRKKYDCLEQFWNSSITVFHFHMRRFSVHFFINIWYFFFDCLCYRDVDEIKFHEVSFFSEMYRIRSWKSFDFSSQFRRVFLTNRLRFDYFCRISKTKTSNVLFSISESCCGNCEEAPNRDTFRSIFWAWASFSAFLKILSTTK